MTTKKKTLDLSAVSEKLAEGPLGTARIKKLEEAQRELTEALLLMVKRVRPYQVPIRTVDNTIRFGVVGDTHIGSGYQRLDALKAFYAHAYDEGVSIVLHAGDVIDGWHVYRGQEFELHPNARSWDDQRAMFEAEAPRCGGLIETIFITGNHEASFRRSVGMNVGAELQRVRPDWKCIGADVGTVTLKTKNAGTFSVMLVHPSDRGGTYALSYKLQKFIEAIPGGEKPDLLVLGHYHKSIHMPAYRNVEAFLPGAFQSQTPFMAAQGSAAHVGGWIVEVVLGDADKLTSRVKAEFIGFYEPEQK
jgi:predicted phosphodiesterase